MPFVILCSLTASNKCSDSYIFSVIINDLNIIIIFSFFISINNILLRKEKEYYFITFCGAVGYAMVVLIRNNFVLSTYFIIVRACFWVGMFHLKEAIVSTCNTFFGIFFGCQGKHGYIHSGYWLYTYCIPKIKQVL